MTESLTEALQREIKRCQELVTARIISTNGRYGGVEIQANIDTAIRALAEGNVFRCLRSYEALKGVKS